MTQEVEESSPHDQSRFRVRFEWGPVGAESVRADVAVVVDVLSFTTTLTVAVERGIEVFPYAWRDSRAAEHALRHGATLAIGRFEALARKDPRHVSLSPASIAAVEGVERLVLPSPNGSTISFALRDSGAQVFGASLRNAVAVADHVAHVVWSGGSVVVIASGERWGDDTLRPAVEDLWGAGAVISSLVARGIDDVSPEARTALAAWRGVADEVATLMPSSSGGRELIEAGFADDVSMAAQYAVSTVVPELVGESFADAAAPRRPGVVADVAEPHSDAAGESEPLPAPTRLRSVSNSEQPPARFDDAVVSGVIGHMNGDHTDDSLDIVRAHGYPGATEASMTDLDTVAGVWRALVDGEEVSVRIEWPGAPLSERPQLRTAVVVLHEQARETLGLEPKPKH